MQTQTIIIALAATLAMCSAQTNDSKPTFIKGAMEIKFNTRTQKDSAGTPKVGITDDYRVDLNVCDSALFRGNIKCLPYIPGTFSSQSAVITYLLDCDVVNPANPAQTKNVGKLYGTVPIEPTGVYKFSQGNLKVGVFAAGTAQGFESKFSGTAAGRPLVRAVGWLDKLKSEAMNIKKQFNGKTVTIVVNKYDKMIFAGHTLGAGPVQTYPEATVNGEMVYDYNRYCWYFNNVTIAYNIAGAQKTDKLTGNIRWIESPNRKVSGEGEYQFDVRVNEPPPDESSAFAGAADEAAFFQTDNSVSALVGTMKYKDVMAGDTVASSAVAINLTGNRLTRQQTMNLAKLILLSSVVPINAE